MPNRRVMVTAGAGSIGSHLCHRFRETGHEVLVVDNLSSGAGPTSPTSSTTRGSS